MPNRLAGESSPYLLQHKDNPVDWYPWGTEALSRARAEDRPILLSVGYSACHWCHVMEHESFSDVATASLMNERFINVKVDREERPDVDALYMQAVQQMTGHGGWPMTVFLTPEGLPFYGGTYYPPAPRHGLPSFGQILEAVHIAFRERREEVERSARELRDSLGRGMNVNPEPTPVDEPMLHRAFQGIRGRFDHRLGGFGGAPKFPQPMILDFLLRYWARTGAAEALGMVETTLDSMARGGIHDHLGGGFHRYSVDARWLVPHFEKMLYDNALLSRTYVRAYQATKRADFHSVAVRTIEFVLRELKHPAGGFYSSLDADSEGEEGRFYVWSADEIDSLLGAEDGSLFRQAYDVTAGGNWEGRNILNAPRPAEELAVELGMDRETLEEKLGRWRGELYAARAERVWPGRDEKVLTSWNAMMLHALAEAAHILHEPEYAAAAAANADFLLRELRSGDRLLRTWRGGTARIDAYLEDHALLVDALVELYRATFDVRWVEEARAIADVMIDGFWSPEEEMFFDTRSDANELVIRPRDIYDNATPSGTSAAAQALIRLGRLTGEPGYEQLASRVVRSLGDIATRLPQAFGHLLGAVVGHVSTPTEVVIVGDPGDTATRTLLETLRQRFLPETIVALRPTDMPEEEASASIPMLANRNPIEGKPTAFVCRHYVCRLPVTTPAALDEELSQAIGATV